MEEVIRLVKNRKRDAKLIIFVSLIYVIMLAESIILNNLLIFIAVFFNYYDRRNFWFLYY